MGSEKRKTAENLVLQASRACGIQTKPEDLQAALDDPQHGPPFAEWILMHLGSDTLLTADELQTYIELDKRGRVDELAELHDLSEVQAVTEDELRLATEQLKRATESINKQTETLRQQQEALSRMLKKEAEAAARREEMERVQQRKKEVERNQLTREVEKITQDVSLQLAQLEYQAPALNDEITTLLESDDKLLLSLQKLGWELDQPDPDEAQAVEKLRETCMRLIKTTVETVRTRLDATYLEALVTAERSGSAKPATSEEVTELQEEVESLYSEILSVAQMSTEQQYLGPALDSIAARTGQSLRKTASSLIYVNECLTYLKERMVRLQAHVKSQKSHQAAAEALVATTKAELAVTTNPITSKQPEPLISPVKTRTNTRTRRNSSGLHEQSALDTLLTGLAISLPPGDDPEVKLQALSEAVKERARKCDDLAKASQESLEATSRAHIYDAKLAIQLLKDSLLAESPFGDIKLIDPDIEESISVLRQEVEKARGKLRALEGQRVVGRSVKRDEFVERWASR